MVALRAIPMAGKLYRLLPQFAHPSLCTIQQQRIARGANTSPPGYRAIRRQSRNLIGKLNSGPQTVEGLVQLSSSKRLNLVTQAGQFGNAGRNIARGPAYTGFRRLPHCTFRLKERPG